MFELDTMRSDGEAGSCAQHHAAGGPHGSQQRADQPGVLVNAERAVAERRHPVDRAAPLPQPAHPSLAQLLCHMTTHAPSAAACSMGGILRMI